MNEQPLSPSNRSQLETRLQQQALLAEIGRRALSHGDFDSLLDEVTRLTALGMSVNYCKILQYLPDQNRFLVRAGVGWQKGIIGRAIIDAGLSSPAGYALHTGKPVISNQLSDEERFAAPAVLAAHNIQRAMNVILLGENHPYGVLEVDSETPGVFTEHDIDFLKGVASMLGLAIEQRQAQEELRNLNETLEQRIEAEVARRRYAEDVLRQSQKMEAVGRLTGGVAHDFNNLLLVIMGNLDLLGRAVSGDERLKRLVATAHKGAARGAQLTNQLLSFARRQQLQPETQLINELIREFDVLATRMLGEAIDVDFALGDEAGACDVDSAQFGSALLNLMVNARDAMPDGGKLVIRTGSLELDANAAARHAEAEPGKYVVVEIADTGTGMSSEVLESATEPFFTTKEVGHGTGLGLSQVYGFVRQSGGFLSIESTVGVGTKICIHLPEVVNKLPSEPEILMEAKAGTGTILIVEDDIDVRDLLAAQVEDLGFDFIVSASGPEALGILAAPGTPPIDLLLTDVVMPGGVDGVALVRAARQTRPELKALLTSGYMAGNRLAASQAEALNLPLLTKPYHQTELARAIQKVLGKD